ncbi:hypothetical protein [Ectothiorhodospira sp. BSL-9]|uniref:hypothetical protein n=1 Tax=Ectothiorhodospira sp. BSL-9 TaxID=1442136 RepID=UPI0012E7F62E|nr:hypothetical protein [Ectothiorhodospira sp. BSL-9]
MATEPDSPLPRLVLEPSPRGYLPEADPFEHSPLHMAGRPRLHHNSADARAPTATRAIIVILGRT